MKRDIGTFFSECDTCQCNKWELIKPLGQLQLLPIPSSIWTNILMDFIVGLPKSIKNSVIMVIVNHLSKYSHFCTLPHPSTLPLVSHIFINKIFKLHGMSTSIFSIHDPTFTSHFWKELFKLQGTRLNMRSSYHLQTNGHTEAINKCVESYLHYFASEKKH